MVRRIAAIFAAFLLISACHRHPRAADSLLEMKVEDWQKAQAADAANHFREIFDNTGCLPIYDEAAAHFRSQGSQDWARECERLKKELGPWKSFQITDAQRCAAPEVVICVFGPAKFEKEQTEIEVAWLLSKGGAQLYWLAVKEGERNWRLIPPMPSRHRWIDPPPVKSPKDSLVS